MVDGLAAAELLSPIPLFTLGKTSRRQRSLVDLPELSVEATEETQRSGGEPILGIS